VPAVVLALGWSTYPVLLGWITIPRAIKNVAALRRLEGRPLNDVLVKSARLVFLYGLSLALGLLLGQLVEQPSGRSSSERLALRSPSSSVTKPAP